MATTRNPDSPARCPCWRDDLNKLKIMSIREGISMPMAFTLAVKAWEKSLDLPKPKTSATRRKQASAGQEAER